jgi:hypothetical protein
MLSGQLAAEIQTDESLLSQRKQQIEASLRNGDLTPLQAEFMLLTTRNLDSPRDRFITSQPLNSDVMKIWRPGTPTKNHSDKLHRRRSQARAVLDVFTSTCHNKLTKT